MWRIDVNNKGNNSCTIIQLYMHISVYINGCEIIYQAISQYLHSFRTYSVGNYNYTSKCTEKIKSMQPHIHKRKLVHMQTFHSAGIDTSYTPVLDCASTLND